MIRRPTPWFELEPRAIDGVPPPHDLNAEARICGALLQYPDFYEDTFPPLTPEHFFSGAHRLVAKACVELHERGAHIEQLAVYELLRDQQLLSQLGGAGALEELVSFVQGTRGLVEAKSAVNVVWNSYQRRQLALLCQQTAAAAFLGGVSTREIFADFEERSGQLVRVAARANDAPHVSEDLATFAGRISRNELPVLIPSGIVAYDSGVDMIRTRELSLVVAGTGVGKTSFGVGRCRAAAGAGFGCLYISTEMTREEIIQRMVSAESGVPVKQVRMYGALDLYQRPKVYAAMDRLRNLPIHIEAEPFGQSARSIRAQIRRLRGSMAARGVELRLVVIDYMQELRLSLGKSGTKAEGLYEAATELKQIAAEQHVHIMGLAQLTIDDKRPANWEPNLGDIADCRGLSKPASTVTFLHRKAPPAGEREPESYPVAMLGRKGRNSGRWRKSAYFHGPICRFEDDHDQHEAS